MGMSRVLTWDACLFGLPQNIDCSFYDQRRLGNAAAENSVLPAVTGASAAVRPLAFFKGSELPAPLLYVVQQSGLKSILHQGPAIHVRMILK